MGENRTGIDQTVRPPLRQQISEMRRWREAGVSDTDIGRRFGCSPQRIGQLLGPSGRQQWREAEFVAAARDLWDIGLSASGVAKRLGVTKNVIIGVAHRHGFPARPSPIRRP